MIRTEYKFIKDIPKAQIKSFEEKTVYNTAVLTREQTKSSSAFPYLTGKLQRTETSAPIVNCGKNEYGLTDGVSYAKYVWAKKNVLWSNLATQSEWYFSIFKGNYATIIHNAVNRAKGEIR